MGPGRFTGEFFIPGESSQRLEADHLERYRFATRFVAGARVLDIACGAGYGARLLRAAGAHEVVGVDISVEALSIARDEYSTDGVAFEQGDITTYTADNSFDVITSFETIEHIADPLVALQNIRRLLRRDGTLLVSSPNRPITSPMAKGSHDKPANTFHIQEFTPRELRRALLETGFVVEPKMFGQRLQPRLPRIASRVWNQTFRPAEHARPIVQPVRRGFAARYFVLVAH